MGSIPVGATRGWMTTIYACHPTLIYVAQKGNTAANTAAILKSCHFFFSHFSGIFEAFCGLFSHITAFTTFLCIFKGIIFKEST